MAGLVLLHEVFVYQDGTASSRKTQHEGLFWSWAEGVDTVCKEMNR